MSRFGGRWAGGGGGGTPATPTEATAVANVTTAIGATATATALIKKGWFVKSIETEITTGLGITSGTTGYAVGDGVDVARYGVVTSVVLGGASDNEDATADWTGAWTADADVVLTAVGGDFDGTGVIQVTVTYELAGAP